MPSRTRFLAIFGLTSVICAIALAQPVHAQNAAPTPVPASKGEVIDLQGMPDQPVPPPGVSVLPAKSLSTQQISAIDPEQVTHPELRITPDKSEIVRLDVEAGTVIVGNPNHISVMAENTKTLVVVPKAPGATYFTVIDNKGNVVMQRHVIVASPKEKYVRIRKSCVTSEDQNCQTTQVYYCPDMCHQILMGGQMEAGSTSKTEELAPLPQQGMSVEQANAIKSAADAVKAAQDSANKSDNGGSEEPAGQ